MTARWTPRSALTTNAAARANRSRRQPEEQRRLSAARRRRLERERRPPAFGAGTFRLRRLPADERIRSCLKTTTATPRWWISTSRRVRATVRARHAASLLVLRSDGDEPEMLMGMRGARHRFMPNRLVFPGGAVDRADLSAPCATALSAHTERHAAQGGQRTTGAWSGHRRGARTAGGDRPLAWARRRAAMGWMYLARAVTPPDSPIRFNARFLLVRCGSRVAATLGGDGELENLRYLRHGGGAGARSRGADAAGAGAAADLACAIGG